MDKLFILNNTVKEIKERKLIKWLTIYLSTGLSILGAVNLFSSRYKISGEIFDYLVIILLLGIPSLLIASWYHGKSGSQSIKRKEIAMHTGFIIIAAALLFIIGKKAPAITEHSVAVLPFNNLSGNKDDEFFSNGITEDILIQLCKISGLKVLSKSSVQKFSGSSMSNIDIGKQLGAENILEGSIRRIGSRVRISGELTSTKDNRNIWAENYDRELTDIFLIQSDVAQQIAEALKVKLTSEEKERIEKKSTSDINAYTLYLKGREFYSRYNKNDNSMAVDLFKKAIKADSNYALAYAGLADAYAQGVQRFGYSEKMIDTALSFCETAIKLNPYIAEPYKALGLCYDMQGFRKKALQHYLKAVELNANYAPAVANIGNLYWLFGDYKNGLSWSRKNISLNPTRAAGYNSLALSYLGLTDFNNAEKNFNTALELQPDYTAAASNLVKLYLVMGKNDLAKNTTLKYLSRFNDDIEINSVLGDVYLFADRVDSAAVYFKKANILPDLGCCYLLLNKEKEGNHILDSLINDYKNIISGHNEDFYPYYDLARIFSVKGELNEAAGYFTKAVESGWLYYYWSIRDPLLKNIRNHPDFITAINIMKSKVQQMKQ